LLDLHHHGYRLAGVLVGLWLLPLGVLVCRSQMFPRLLGTALIVAGIGWIVDTLVVFAAPDLPDLVGTVLSAARLAECWLVIHLLIRGVRTPPPSPAAQTAPTAGSMVR
jgi:hypothetical protein